MMTIYRTIHERSLQACVFEEGKRKLMKTVACIKYGLFLDGIIRSPLVAKRTPTLTDEQRKVFSERYRKLNGQIRTTTNPLWISRQDPAPGALTMAV